MRIVFVDTSFYVAILNRRDRLRRRAQLLYAELTSRGDVVFVTTEAVLVELLTRMSGFGAEARDLAADFVTRLAADPRVTIVPFTSESFAAGLDLYRRRSDKTYSMTDCMSMALCKQQKIAEILTSDHDFQQERFTILLGDA